VETLRKLQQENEDLRRKLAALERLTDENYRLHNKNQEFIKYQEDTEVMFY